jgi:hypothetical protein
MPQGQRPTLRSAKETAPARHQRTETAKLGRISQNVCLVHHQTTTCVNGLLFGLDRFLELFGFPMRGLFLSVRVARFDETSGPARLSPPKAT